MELTQFFFRHVMCIFQTRNANVYFWRLSVSSIFDLNSDLNGNDDV